MSTEAANEKDFKAVTDILEFQNSDESLIRSYLDQKIGVAKVTTELQDIEKVFEKGFYKHPNFFVSSS